MTWVAATAAAAARAAALGARGRGAWATGVDLPTTKSSHSLTACPFSNANPPMSGTAL